MYDTCLHCTSTLGRNDLLETFPVGRRLAYDMAAGRLWVVCRRCGAWCLVPFDERWTAMENAERLYRRTRTRVATGEIALARLRDGRGAVDLVRIGRPLRPEFAAWRYGERFVARRRRSLVATGAGSLGLAANLLGATALLSSGVGVGLMGAAYLTEWYLRRHTQRATLRLRAGEHPVTLASEHLSRLRLLARGDALALRVVHPPRRRDVMAETITLLEGDDALRAMRIVLPAVNAKGGSRQRVGDAVGLLESELGTPRDALVLRLATHGPLAMFQQGYISGRGDERWLGHVPLERRLALEMALNEEVERRALEGELALLEAAWRDAETVARIADSLAVPADIERQVRTLGARRDRDDPPVRRMP